MAITASALQIHHLSKNAGQVKMQAKFIYIVWLRKYHLLDDWERV